MIYCLGVLHGGGFKKYLRFIHNSKQLMQPTTTTEVLLYPEHVQQDVQEFKKRLTVEEFKAIDPKRIKREFQTLETSKIPNYNHVAHSGEKHKDRYSNIHAYKHNRVMLQKVDNFYINASYMRSVLDGNVYAIFAQAPVENVIGHFWAACYHHKIRKIIMLCAFEDPNRGQQAEKYWPQVGKNFSYPQLGLRVTCQGEKDEGSDFTRTSILFEGSQGERTLEHIHWTGWSDMRKPLGEKSEGLFRGLVQDCLQLTEHKELFLIHCSAGIGRTGTLGTMIEALRCARKENRVSVFEIVDNMRRNRMACVQTMEQYGFIYQQLKNMM